MIQIIFETLNQNDWISIVDSLVIANF